MRLILALVILVATGCAGTNQTTDNYLLPTIAELGSKPIYSFQKTGQVVLDVSHDEFDSCHAKYPAVINFNGAWLMYYSARASNCLPGAIGLAVWNGSAWIKQGPVLAVADHPSVVIESGVIHMWYTSRTGSGYVINYGTSEDGYTFFEHGTVLKGGLGILHPSVVAFHGQYHMFVNIALPNGTLGIKHYTSYDRLQWVSALHDLRPTQLQGIAERYIYNPFVRVIDDKLEMFYSAQVNGTSHHEPVSSCIVYATSDDGSIWSKDVVPTLCNGTFAEDGYATFAPTVFEFGSELHMYYSAGDSKHMYRTMDAILGEE